MLSLTHRYLHVFITIETLNSSKHYIWLGCVLWLSMHFNFSPISCKILMTENVLYSQTSTPSYYSFVFPSLVCLSYSQTCIKQSPCIKLWVVRVPSLFPISHGIFTSIEWSNLWSGYGHLWVSPNSLFVLSFTFNL